VTYTVCHLNNNVDEVSASLALSCAAKSPCDLLERCREHEVWIGKVQ
jgi:hypothetical protein